MSQGKLSGKVAVITGSTDGIGFAIAKRLAIDGASVVVSSRNSNKVEQAVSEIKSVTENVAGTVYHAGIKEDLIRLLDFAVSKFGGIDILINNAAVNPSICQILDTPEEAWDKIFDINVKASFLLTKAAVPLIKKRGGGSVIYISSIMAYQMISIIGAYSVSKTALLGLTKAVAAQCSSSNIRVNCVCPGAIDTEFLKSLKYREDLKHMVNDRVAMKRYGKPSELAGIVSFLCSEDASYITGESFSVDGGCYARL